MLIAVGIDKSQSITNAVFIDHKETIPFFQKILAKNIPSSLSGTLYLDLLEKENSRLRKAPGNRPKTAGPGRGPRPN